MTEPTPFRRTAGYSSERAFDHALSRKMVGSLAFALSQIGFMALSHNHHFPPETQERIDRAREALKEATEAIK